MIFPHFKNIQVIEDIRKKYDPLAEHVKPHITLVFPFESHIETSKLEEHMKNMTSDIRPFDIVLGGITPSASFGNYLFLNIIEGNKQIAEIHKRLYCGILKEFYPAWLNNTDFMPHMTIGNISDSEAFNRAVDATKNFVEIFKTTVNTISVEIIDENEDSTIELNIPLK